MNLMLGLLTSSFLHACLVCVLRMIFSALQILNDLRQEMPTTITIHTDLYLVCVCGYTQA